MSGSPPTCRVLCLSVYPGEGPSVRHRILTYRAPLARHGVTLSLRALLTHGLYRRRRQFGRLATLYKLVAFAFCTLRLALRLLTVARYDAVIIHREAYPIGPPWFERAVQRLARRCFFDVDDAIWEPMPLKVDQRGRLQFPQRFDHIMRGSSAVVVGNEYLAEYARPLNQRVTVIPTPYRDLGGPDARPARNDTPVIVWIGNVGNEEYLDLLRAPLTRIAAEQDFVFRIIGSPAVRDFTIDGVSIDARVWSEEDEAALLLGADIGVMPLLDRSYERGKCAFKLVQYFSAGLAVMASPVGMNREVVVHGSNGFLAADEQAWYAGLSELLANKERREAFARAGYRTYRERFTPEVNAGSWLALLQDQKGPGQTA